MNKEGRGSQSKDDYRSFSNKPAINLRRRVDDRLKESLTRNEDDIGETEFDGKNVHVDNNSNSNNNINNNNMKNKF